MKRTFRFLAVLLAACVAVPGEAAPKEKEPIVAAKKETPPDARLLVKFKKDVTEAKRQALLSKHKLVRKKKPSKTGLEILEVPASETAEEAADRLRALEAGSVEFVEVDALVPPAFVPNDPGYADQWHHPKMNAPAAWDASRGQGLIAAVADSGVEATHPEFAGRILSGWNTVNDSSDSSPVHWHGTAVAGTIAAAGNNGAAVAGTSWNASILPIRVSNFSDGSAYVSDIAEAVTYAADRGAKVVNTSYGVGCSPSVQSAAEYMRSKGGLVTVSAGNEGDEKPCADSPFLVVVSATDRNDLKTSWSSYGAFVDVAAPGQGILTTDTGASVASVSGTSFSAPLAGAVAILAWRINPSLTPDQMQGILQKSVVDLGPAGKDPQYGWGRLDAWKATYYAKASLGDTLAPSTPSGLRAGVSSGKVNLAWNASSDNVAVTGYRILRGGTQAGTSAAPSYSDSPPAGTHTYAVQAYDAAGNSSAVSASVTATTSAALQITKNYVSGKSQTTVNIYWETNLPAGGYIRYGRTWTEFPMTSVNAPVSTAHTTRLSGLLPYTIYYYQIVSDGGVKSPVSSFRTA